jgi:hypothetical protein
MLEKELAELLKKLGLGVEDGISHLIRYTVIDAWMGVLFGIGILFSALIIARSVIKAFPEDEKDLVRMWLGGILFFLTLIFGAMIVANIEKIIEPRGYLINRVVR